MSSETGKTVIRNPAHSVREFWTCFAHVVAGCDSAVEFGCGMGWNLNALSCRGRRLGIEIVPEYPRTVQGVEFIIGDALVEAKKLAALSFDLVLLIDVVEHFDREDGFDLLAEACRVAAKKVLLWVPEGFMRQDVNHFDAAGSGYDYRPSQEHKSGWTKEDLEPLGFDVAVWPDYHWDRETEQKNIGALFCVWERGE